MSKWRLRRRRKHGCYWCEHQVWVGDGVSEDTIHCGQWLATRIGTHRTEYGERSVLRPLVGPCLSYLDVEEAERLEMVALIEMAEVL